MACSHCNEHRFAAQAAKEQLSIQIVKMREKEKEFMGELERLLDDNKMLLGKLDEIEEESKGVHHLAALTALTALASKGVREAPPPCLPARGEAA